MTRKQRTAKSESGQLRDKTIQIRLSVIELELLTKLCDKRKLIGSDKWSRIDVIVDALKYSDGQIIF